MPLIFRPHFAILIYLPQMLQNYVRYMSEKSTRVYVGRIYYALITKLLKVKYIGIKLLKIIFGHPNVPNSSKALIKVVSIFSGCSCIQFIEAYMCIY